MATRNLCIFTGHLVSEVQGMKDAVKFDLLSINKRKDGPDERCQVQVVAFGALANQCTSDIKCDWLES